MPLNSHIELRGTDRRGEFFKVFCLGGAAADPQSAGDKHVCSQ